MNVSSLIISSIVQVALFSFIPFTWWVVTARKKESFFLWIGLKKPSMENKRQFIIIFLCSLLLFTTLSFIVPLFVDTNNLATSQFVGKNSVALVSVFLYSFIQTGLSEEILFRGFLTKRLCSRFGFTTGNLIQSILFGGLHGAMLYSFTGLFGVIFTIVYTGSLGWFLGWMNEKKSSGSIIPSWFFHSISNFAVSMLVMFNII